MVGQLAARHALSADVVEGVSERTGGVPLFVEEVTRLLLESRSRAARTRSRRPCSNRSRPGSTGSGAAREIAQIGAVLGRDFPLCAAA